MDIINSSNYQITLGSGSSRRKELLEMTGIKFDINSNKFILERAELILIKPLTKNALLNIIKECKKELNIDC